MAIKQELRAKRVVGDKGDGESDYDCRMGGSTGCCWG